MKEFHVRREDGRIRVRPVGEVTLVVRAGQGGQPVKVRNLVIDLTQLTGDAEFTNMQIGRDADISENSTGERSTSPGWGWCMTRPRGGAESCMR
jgi:hypothetical protein